MLGCIESPERLKRSENSGAFSVDELYQRYLLVNDKVDGRSNLSDSRPHFEDVKGTAHYAGFWRRFVAFLIDSTIVMIIGCTGGSVIGLLYGFLVAATTVGDINYDSIIFEAGVLGLIWGIAADCLYFTALESSPMQATPGKLAMNIIVTNYEFRRIGFGQANARYWGKLVSSLILCIGFLMVAFTEKKQALHDQLAGTLVIVKRR